MLDRKLVFAGLLLAGLAFPAVDVSAKDIVIVAIDDPLSWESEGLKSEAGTLQVPVEVGDVLHFKFAAQAAKPHGVTTQDEADLSKVQKRGQAGGDEKYLKELGEGASDFDKRIPATANEEMTQVEVLPGFKSALNLMCKVHDDAMLMTLKKSEHAE